MCRNIASGTFGGGRQSIHLGGATAPCPNVALGDRLTPSLTVMLDNAKFLIVLLQNMVLRIFKMIATSGFLAALKCIKFVFGRSSAPDPTGEFTVFPQTL